MADPNFRSGWREFQQAHPELEDELWTVFVDEVQTQGIRDVADQSTEGGGTLPRATQANHPLYQPQDGEEHGESGDPLIDAGGIRMAWQSVDEDRSEFMMQMHHALIQDLYEAFAASHQGDQVAGAFVHLFFHAFFDHLAAAMQAAEEEGADYSDEGE